MVIKATSIARCNCLKSSRNYALDILIGVYTLHSVAKFSMFPKSRPSTNCKLKVE